MQAGRKQPCPGSLCVDLATTHLRQGRVGQLWVLVKKGLGGVHLP